MTVKEIMEGAARFSNRDDEFIIEEGETDYLDEALKYKLVFLSAINEAQREAAKRLGRPVERQLVTPDNYLIDLTALYPVMTQLKYVRDATDTYLLASEFRDAETLRVYVSGPVTLVYIAAPDEMTALTDEPFFPPEVVPEELYMFLAAARVYQSERKESSAQVWLGQYYDALRKIRPFGSGISRRVPRRSRR